MLYLQECLDEHLFLFEAWQLIVFEAMLWLQMKLENSDFVSVFLFILCAVQMKGLMQHFTPTFWSTPQALVHIFLQVRILILSHCQTFPPYCYLLF